MVSTETKTHTFHMMILASKMLVGIPFIVYSISFPAFLLIVGFVSAEAWAIEIAYMWIWAMIGIGIYLEAYFIMQTRAGFLKRHGVSSLTEFFKKTYSKDARAERKSRNIASEARGVVYSNRIDQIHKNMTERRNGDEETNYLENRKRVKSDKYYDLFRQRP